MRVPVVSARLLLSVLLTVLFVSTVLQAVPMQGQFLATGAGVRVRSQPSTTGSKVGMLDLGEIVPLVARTDKKATVGKATEYWFQVTLPNGKSGWVFGSLGTPFDQADAPAHFRALALNRMKRDDLKAEDHLSLYHFLDRIHRQQPSPALRYEFSLYRILALQLYLNARGYELQEKDIPSHPDLKGWQKNLVYSEPAGQWLVAHTVLWDLHKEAEGSPVADLIAWKAANHMLPGETEGYPPAVMDYMALTMCAYLAAHPDGEHAVDALVSYTATLEPFAADLPGLKEQLPDKEEHDRFIEILQKARTVISGSSQPAKDQAIRLIDKILGRP